MKKFILIVLASIVALSIFGCGTKEEAAKIKDLEFTVTKEDNLPKELAQLIEDKKKSPFKMTYSTKEYMYIVVGYGEQSMGGYSIIVKDLYLTDNGIYIDTNLAGPSQDEEAERGATYPFIVIKTELYDKPIVFH